MTKGTDYRIFMKKLDRVGETTLIYSSLKSKYLKTELSHKMYQVKVIDCGDYVQIYKFSNYHFKKDDSFIDIKSLDTDNLNKKGKSELKSILLSNAIRSNLSVQRLARCNHESWNSFITLTFADTDKFDITCISDCNKKFNQWVSNIRKLKKDFKYLAVPEFQKERGKKYGVEAVHYHLLSNLDIDDHIIYEQINKKGRAVGCSTLYDVKYWIYGYSQYYDFFSKCSNNDKYKKIYSYLTKYMCKDIDNKLFGKKRYFFSQNLIRPKTSYINLHVDSDLKYLDSLIFDKIVDYHNVYQDSYSGTDIEYFEYKKDTI